jgi:hypothetical protein
MRQAAPTVGETLTPQRLNGPMGGGGRAAVPVCSSIQCQVLLCVHGGRGLLHAQHSVALRLARCSHSAISTSSKKLLARCMSVGSVDRHRHHRRQQVLGSG